MWGNQVEMDQNLSDNLKTLSVNPHIRKEGLKKWNGLHDVYSHKGFFLFSVVPISAVCDATWVPAWLVEDTLNGGAVTRRSVRSSSWEWKFTAVNIVMRNVVPDMWWMDSVMFSCVCMVPVKPVRGLQCGEGSAFVLLLSTETFPFSEVITFGVEHAEHFSSHSWVSEAVGNTTPSWAYVREHIHARAQIQLWNRYWAPEFGLSSSGLVSVKGQNLHIFVTAVTSPHGRLWCPGVQCERCSSR